MEVNQQAVLPVTSLYIGPGVRIEGRVSQDNPDETIIIAGVMAGDIVTQGRVLVESGGTIEAANEIKCFELDIKGAVLGADVLLEAGILRLGASARVTVGEVFLPPGGLEQARGSVLCAKLRMDESNAFAKDDRMEVSLGRSDSSALGSLNAPAPTPTSTPTSTPTPVSAISLLMTPSAFVEKPQSQAPSPALSSVLTQEPKVVPLAGKPDGAVRAAVSAVDLHPVPAFLVQPAKTGDGKVGTAIQSAASPSTGARFTSHDLPSSFEDTDDSLASAERG